MNKRRWNSSSKRRRGRKKERERERGSKYPFAPGLIFSVEESREGIGVEADGWKGGLEDLGDGVSWGGGVQLGREGCQSQLSRACC